MKVEQKQEDPKGSSLITPLSLSLTLRYTCQRSGLAFEIDVKMGVHNTYLLRG